MLVFVERRRQVERVFFELRGQGLRREQLHLAVVQQLDDAFDFERDRATGKLAFFAALFDGDARDGVGVHKGRQRGGKRFDMSGAFIVVQGNLFSGNGHVLQTVGALGGHGENGFTAFDINAANSHKKPVLSE